jgi:carbonic anhydrase
MRRRHFLGLLGLGGLAATLAAAENPAGASAAAHGAGLAPDEALKRLIEGNRRFVGGKPLHPNQGTLRRGEVARGQRPFAVVLGCADSRVPPEVVFDQGLGDRFVGRVAGNTADDAVVGSIEYAVEHLGARLIMVLSMRSAAPWPPPWRPWASQGRYLAISAAL